jgi:hypothetical protein
MFDRPEDREEQVHREHILAEPRVSVEPDNISADQG